MIGLTLVTVVAVLGSGISAGDEVGDHEQVHADYVIDGNEGLPFRASEGDELAGDPRRHRRLARPLGRPRSYRARRATISGVDPATIGHFYTFDWTTGSPHARRSSGPTARSSRKTTPRPST